ncbi:uncharacterized protein LOC123539159 [Mercenaria mercenaria]|uniref:uncharacterized protein LOC123539159 n=1 Tax=Mercenaria mercenaria TaxID=6596 RepID=UPI00234F72CB|nr:uncharacterized protein LOC123539159 [Mercenaria mercenaria]XP_045179592.2 uncharacterized protein LOC123539159 [Mercenaria mercenaria]
MVSVGLYILETIAAIETVFRLSQQYALMLDKNVTVVPVEDQPDIEPRIEPLIGHSTHRTSIHHFSRHGLCSKFEGKRKLYKALKTKFCNTKLSFTAGFVVDLCRRRDGMLDKWVGELFDIDGDGFVTHHEKNIYNYIT